MQMRGLYESIKSEVGDIVVARGGLTKWFKENWVDLSRPKKGGGYHKCGRKKAKKGRKGYPKCVPASKAASMSKAQVRSAIRRKRAKPQGVGGVQPWYALLQRKAERREEEKDERGSSSIRSSYFLSKGVFNSNRFKSR